ncbi:GNAT family N-acetyltransferase [Ruegeria arenilitoris]|uniref:GNAT family N-acetyltransferase n=1 Tax=Ruegeria arenilitoris TaxID=1173585 RepID=UPI00147E9B54|nr:GNAT family N-acetyltransferase [Ruegeria arenilitoris]
MAWLIEETDSEDLALELEASLLNELSRRRPQGVNSTIELVCHKDGVLKGGLLGTTSYGWFLLKILWVAPPFRRQGLARALFDRACTLAKARDCHSVWLDTSDPKARQVYLRWGFVQFGHLENGPDKTPPEHCRWFLQRLII